MRTENTPPVSMPESSTSSSGIPAQPVEAARLVAGMVRDQARVRTPLEMVRDTAAFTLSALLSPYLVIPAGTLFVIGSLGLPRVEAWKWTLLSVFFSTFTTAIYVSWGVFRGHITDVHVMERQQRGGPFTVAILSSLLGSYILWRLGAPREVWIIGLVLAVNGFVMTLVTTAFKISMHVAVLSSTVLAALLLVEGISFWKLGWMVPALIWARVTRGRHTLWQGIAACAVSCLLTFLVLRMIPGQQ